MKNNIIKFVVIAAVIILTGCSTGRNVGVTNKEQPGPSLGYAIGAGAGAVAGNVAGGVVSAGEGFGGAAKSSFDNTQRIVRYWREEKTTDGRTILVPEDFLVDANGQVLHRIH